MLNFRKLKQDFSSTIVKEGKELFEKNKVVSAKLMQLDGRSMRIVGRISGQFDNTYECQIEIDREECELIDSDCDCPYNYDCQHLAALLFYIEEHLDRILVSFSKGADFMQMSEEETDDDFDVEEKANLIQKIKEAESKEEQRQEEQFQRQLLQEYVTSAELLAISPFFRAAEKYEIDRAEFSLIFTPLTQGDKDGKNLVEIQLALRLPSRSKPLHIPHVKQFLEKMRYAELLFIGSKRFRFSLESFDPAQQEIVRMVMDHARFPDVIGSERAQRAASIDGEIFGLILAKAYELASEEAIRRGFSPQDEELPILTGLYESSLESPLRFSLQPAQFRFALEYIPPPTSKILLNPTLIVDAQVVQLEEAKFFECAKPGMLYRNAYYRFSPKITRLHLRNLHPIREMTIPQPLFGSFVENALPELSRFTEVANQRVIEDFVTLPFVGQVKASCDLSFLNGELDAVVHFHYDKHKIPAAATQLNYAHVSSFVSEEGVLARNLVEERKILEDLFSDFAFNPETGAYVTKSDKKIVEFMTDLIPRHQDRVTFNCPQNLLDQFIYDQTRFTLKLAPT